MNKMDDFLKKQLTEYTPDEDGWNVPSEELWENALPHFPKKKKSNRGLIFFWTSLSAILILATVYLVNFNNPQANPIETKNAITSKTSKENILSAIQNETIDPIPQNMKKEDLSVPSSTIINQVNTGIQHETTIGESRKIKTVKQQLNSSNIRKSLKNQSNENIISNSSNLYRSTYLPTNHSSITQSNAKQERTRSNLNASATKIKPPLASLSILPTLRLNLIDVAAATLPVAKSNALITPGIKRFSLPKEEVGIAHLAYPVYWILKSVEFDSDNPTDVFDFTGNYKNANGYYNRWISPRWSVSTGFHYSKFDLGLSFNIQDTVGVEIEELINDKFEESINRSTNVNTRNDIEVTTVDGETIEQGDIVQIRGKVGLKLEGFQIPLMMNYHFYNQNNFEYGLGFGVSIDYLRLIQSDIDLMIFKSDGLVATASQNEVSESNFDYSVYAQSFMRYRITPNINIGMSLKISVLSPVFSGFETGIYYRWNR